MRKPLTEADGRKLAIDMLIEVDGYETAPGDVDSLWPWSIRAMFRPEGAPQDNVLLRYLDKIKSREALAGFCAVLTDYLGEVGDTGPGTPHLWVYRQLSERDITGTPGTWPKMPAA